MSIIFLLIPLSVLIATGFLGAFIWAVRTGQYEDTCTPAMRLLMQDSVPRGRALTRGRAGNHKIPRVAPLKQPAGSGRAEASPASQTAGDSLTSTVSKARASSTPKKLRS